jgi:hypothetical protein
VKEQICEGKLGATLAGRQWLILSHEVDALMTDNSLPHQSSNVVHNFLPDRPSKKSYNSRYDEKASRPNSRSEVTERSRKPPPSAQNSRAKKRKGSRPTLTQKIKELDRKFDQQSTELKMAMLEYRGAVESGKKAKPPRNLAKMHFGEGLRIPAVRIWDRGEYRQDVVKLITANTRAPDDVEGDHLAQAEATKVAEQEILRLVEKYGKVTAFAEVQDYVEQLTRQKVSELPDGTWETEDYIDQDPSTEEGLIPIKVKMTIDGDEISYDLSGSHPVIGSFLNAGIGTGFSGIVAGTKTFFLDVPLNSGFYRVIDANLPKNTVVNAPRPTAVTGFCSGAYEKIMSYLFELWSQAMPDRALACWFNLEYLLIGGWDKRTEASPFFMWYEWMVGGWGGRNSRDGSNATSPVFGVGLAVQPLEGQERLSPVVTSTHQMVPDSGAPGQYRGGSGVQKGGTTHGADPTLVFLFALFHDSMRLNDNYDPLHGPRGAALARELRGEAFDLEDAEMGLLAFACEEHTKGGVDPDPTVGVCWDADRLNLWRVGIRPNPRFLSTEAARSEERIAWAHGLQQEHFAWAELYRTFRFLAGCWSQSGDEGGEGSIV